MKGYGYNNYALNILTIYIIIISSFILYFEYREKYIHVYCLKNERIIYSGEI